MFKCLRKIRRFVCKLFYTEIDNSAYMPLMNIETEYEYIPIPMSQLSPEGGSDDNIAFYD